MLKIVGNIYVYISFDGMINAKSLDPNKIKIDENSYENILIYHLEYVTVEDFAIHQLIV